MSNRRTSVYTIRLQDQFAADVAAFELREANVPISDHGDASVSFRAPSDAAAARIANRAVATVEGSAYLTTGLGVHRRTVEAACLTRA